MILKGVSNAVSTHSRLKAAGPNGSSTTDSKGLGFNTQPPEGGWFTSHNGEVVALGVSTHSRLKAAG